ncbi:MAG TPA: N-acetylmuramoyl-L-alanine amidase [Candidatus Krumholzibacteria bacterium]|nr:N-acetylmuramoyl-L-alanine amidase [Candidatus Krumholzibacteria bacterium]
MVSGAIAGSLAWPGPAVAERILRVDAIRHSVSEERTRVVIDLSRPAEYSVTRLADSVGVSVSFRGAALSLDVVEIAVGRNGVRAVRPVVDAGVVSICFDLDRPATWEVFALPAEGGKPNRVVVDLVPAPTAPAVATAPAPETTAPVSEPIADAVDRTAGDTMADAGAPPPLATAPPMTKTAPSKPRPFVVAVDAGHGGHDAGAIGRYGLVEKKLCLDIARRVAEILNRNGNVRAVLTRDRDEYLTLPRRNELAEQKGADVFVSIHLNSAPSRSARGAEIYFVAPAGAERAANQALASGEAAHDFGLEESGNSDLVHMLLDVNQQAVLARSELLAESILESVRKRALLPTRAVKQKSFSVLRTISMPCVLVEAGFISNNADAKLVKDPDGREKVARAVADGVIEFFRAHPPQRVEVASTTASLIHRVQRGDTLWTLSRRYGTTVARIRELNGLSPSQELHVGQELVVPSAN